MSGYGVLCYQPPAMTSATLDMRQAPLPHLLANRPLWLRVGVVLLCGWAGLAIGSDVLAAFAGGVVPFLPGAAVKAVAAALIVTLALARRKAT